jgi:hypothetical protein
MIVWNLKKNEIDATINLKKYAADENSNSSAAKFVFNRASGDLLVNIHK